MIPEMSRLFNYFKLILFEVNSKGLLFNQYKQTDIMFDKQNGNLIRQDNLQRYMESFTEKPEKLLLGEAPGCYGCRFSGIPFTSEKQLIDPSFWLQGCSASSFYTPFEEFSGRVLWNVLTPFHDKFFIHNTIPFHPFAAERQALTNRTPTREEIDEHLQYLEKIIDILKPKEFVAIGRVAEGALKLLNVKKIVYARHMSHGGEKLFTEKIRSVFNIPDDHEKTTQLKVI